VRIGRIVVDQVEWTVCPTNTPRDVIEFADLEQQAGRFVGDWPAVPEPRSIAPLTLPPPDPECTPPGPVPPRTEQPLQSSDTGEKR
jgi:hypothetical protein